MGSDITYGNNGLFVGIQSEVSTHREIIVLASDGLGWEHVSLHIIDKQADKMRTPLWAEMCQIKDLFWDEEDVVVQYHPRKSEYVNNHPNVLHLWRKAGEDFPTPPKILVGIAT